MSGSDDLEALCAANGVDEAFATWLIANGLNDYNMFAAACSDYNCVNADLIPAYAQSLGSDMLNVAQKAKIRWLGWLLVKPWVELLLVQRLLIRICWNPPMPEGAEDGLVAQWRERYRFNLPVSHLVTQKLLRQI